MNHENTDLHRRLRRLVGDCFDYLGEPWILVEVLQDLDSVVLKRVVEGPRGSLTADLYGLPVQTGSLTLTIQISGGDADAYSDDLMLLLEGRRRG